MVERCREDGEFVGGVVAEALDVLGDVRRDHSEILDRDGSAFGWFGNQGVITDNDPAEQEKTIKFNRLLANCAIFHTTVDMMTVILDLQGRSRGAGLAGDVRDLARRDPVKPGVGIAERVDPPQMCDLRVEVRPRRPLGGLLEPLNALV